MKRFFLILLLSNSLYSQNLDSLYSLLTGSLESNLTGTANMRPDIQTKQKCAFGLNATVMTHLHEFTKEQRKRISEILARPELSKSIVSPSGIFRIHYDDSGSNQIGYDINELAEAFDSSYYYEVNVLGYPPPPKDGDLGGDDKLDVYLVNLARDYGSTTPEVSLGNGRYTSWIQMDNDFSKAENYNTFGIDAAKVTAAHELHHTIQLGNYIYRYDDLFYYELTSTAFEEFVFDGINDYYYYMLSFFRSTSAKLANSTGYNSAVWNVFLEEYFKDEDPMLGHKIILKSWENMIGNRAMAAIANAIESETSFSFAQLYNDFGSWLYFTGSRSKTDRFFEEAVNYPQVRSTYTLDLNSTRTINFNSEPTSINYLTFRDYDFGFADTVVAVVSNSDILGSLTNIDNQFINLTLSNSIFDDGLQINDIYFYKIDSDKLNKLNFIQSNYIINNELSDLIIQRNDVDFVYPQPFYYKDSFVNLPAHPDPTEKAELSVYSSDMDMVYSGNEPIITSGNTVIRWNCLNDRGEKLGSGIYVFVTKSGGKIKKGKFVVLN